MPALPKPRWLENLVYYVTLFALSVFRVLPLQAARLLGGGMGRLAYYLSHKSRRITHINLRLAFPEKDPKEKRDLAARRFQEIGKFVAELGHLWLRPWPSMSHHITVEGRELITTSEFGGPGCIVLIPHIGNWEVMSLFLASEYNLVALYKPIRFSRLDDFVKSGRQKAGARLVPVSGRGVTEILRAVRSGGVTAILPDQVPANESSGLNIPFFGIKCATATLPYKLKEKSAAKVILGTALRTKNGFSLIFRDLDTIMSNGPEEALTGINRAIEESIIGNEAQYLWEYKRFKCRPAGEIDHYG